MSSYEPCACVCDRGRRALAPVPTHAPIYLFVIAKLFYDIARNNIVT